MSKFGKSNGGGRRSAARMAVPLTAVITTLHESRSAILVDVSATGARLRGPNILRSDEELFLTVDGIVIFGTVAWAKNDECGVAFDSQLEASTEKRLRHKVVQAEGLPPELKAAFDDWSVGIAR